ncbi:MAG: hypothetical protein GY757_39390 [bacterium]|nr:hypothetical protein [bacterium]
MRTQIQLISIMLSLSLLMGHYLPAKGKKSETIEVTAVGEAAGTGVAGREKSRENALRNAVEKGFGVYVDSATLAENAAIIHDDVVAQTRGYVKDYDILKQTEQDGIVTTQIKARVSMEKIWESDTMQLLLKRMGAPRFIILSAEEHEGRPAATSFALQKVTEQLVARGFNLVKATNTGDLNTGQIQRALADNQQAAEIGKKANAEIVVLLDTTARFVKQSHAYGQNFSIYRGNNEIKAVQVDTGTIIASSVKTRQSGTIKKAVMNAANDNAGEIVKQLLSAWSDYLNMGRTIQLEITGITVTQLMRIVEEIQSVEGVSSVTQRDYQARRANLEIKSKHKAMYLAESIETLPGIKLEISRFSADKIVARKKN